MIILYGLGISSLNIFQGIVLVFEKNKSEKLQQKRVNVTGVLSKIRTRYSQKLGALALPKPAGISSFTYKEKNDVIISL